MDTLIVDGVYEDGRVELRERPPGVERARVRVTFLPELQGTDKDGERVAVARQVLSERLLARLERGFDFGDEPIPTREELYADRLRRF